MKNVSRKFLVTAMIVASVLCIGEIKAEESATTPQAHEQHHVAAKPETKSDMKENMDKGMMTDMMGKCMSMHKDGKMCDHQTMDKCKMHMGKKACAKMMKEMKSETK